MEYSHYRLNATLPHRVTFVSFANNKYVGILYGEGTVRTRTFGQCQSERSKWLTNRSKMNGIVVSRLREILSSTKAKYTIYSVCTRFVGSVLDSFFLSFFREILSEAITLRKEKHSGWNVYSNLLQTQSSGFLSDTLAGCTPPNLFFLTEKLSVGCRTVFNPLTTTRLNLKAFTVRGNNSVAILRSVTKRSVTGYETHEFVQMKNQ